VTVKEWAKDYCESRGMSETQAARVVERFCVRYVEIMPNDAGRLDDQIEGYPAPMVSLWAMDLNRAAVEWIDENLPLARFRPMFAGMEGEQLGAEAGS
jgi:hypothetical protein